MKTISSSQQQQLVQPQHGGHLTQLKCRQHSRTPP